jgi:hypothetical protein
MILWTEGNEYSALTEATDVAEAQLTSEHFANQSPPNL